MEIRQLSCKAGKFLLKGINARLVAGEYLMVAGPTGSGKTLLLETLAGLRHPSEGHIYLNGEEITDFPPEKRFLGFAYQDSLLYPFMNVRDNILFAAKVRDKGRNLLIQRRLAELADIMKITHLLERFPRFLSGGEKQRVSLARAILLRPPLLLLDEPLSALDSQTKSSLRELLRELHRENEMIVIHVTHDPEEALQLGTRLLVLEDGQMKRWGTPRELIRNELTFSTYPGQIINLKQRLRPSILWTED